MKIRKATMKDINHLIKLMQDADNRNKEWSEHRAKKFVINKNKDRLILVAMDEGKFVGYVGIKKYENNSARDFVNLNDYAWIVWIAVLSEYRGKSIGSVLLKSAEKYVYNYNKKGLLLDCRQKLITFYVKNGFNIAGEYIDKGFPRYIMRKTLK